MQLFFNMVKIRILGLLFSVLFAATCTQKVKEASIDYFAQANALKTETLEIQQRLVPHLQNLRQQRNSIMIQGRPLTEAEITFIDQVNELIEIQGDLSRYLEDIDRSENAYEPNGQELLYLNQQANTLTKKIQKKIESLTAQSN